MQIVCVEVSYGFTGLGLRPSEEPCWTSNSLYCVKYPASNKGPGFVVIMIRAVYHIGCM